MSDRRLQSAKSMRLSILLTVVFLALASLVGVMGFLYDRTGAAVLADVESVQARALVEVAGATEMLLALQASQVAAQELLAERYRARVEPDHESEWGSAGDIDRGAVKDSLERFEEALEEAHRRGAPRDGADGERQAAALRRIDGAFAVYRNLMDRFIHLARYHPSDQMREFIEDELRPHYRREMLEPIRSYQREVSERLRTDVQEVEGAIADANARNRWLTLLALAAATLFGLVLARSISRPIARLAASARAYGQGADPQVVDLTDGREIPSEEIGALAAAFRQMVADLEARTISLHEKDVLLKEIHHRVKNNLQIVSSLLSLQEDQESDPQARNGLRDSRHRVQAMALIHEHLYLSDDLAEVDFPDFLRELVERIGRSHGAVGESLRLTVAAEDVSLGLDQAIPCGMIVNELVSNALEHAAPAGATAVDVTLTGRPEQFELTVRDDGPGLPEDFDPANLESLGLKLVSELAEQLGAELSWQSEAGAVFTLRRSDPAETA